MPVAATIHHSDGSSQATQLDHTLNEEQIAWFKAGSALNALNAR